MPDYKRLVSYMYNYEDGLKKHNVGYARVEARNGQCKCTLHVAAPSLNDKQLKVYMFKKNNDGFEGILLGTLQVRNGVGDYRTVTDPLHIMNSSYGLDDMGGIVLYYTERKFLATSWDETPITMDRVAGMENKKYDNELKAANVIADKTETAVKTPENNTGSVKESAVKEAVEETERYGRQEKQQVMKESQEYRNDNEGEVFNDLDNGKDSRYERTPDTEDESDKVAAKEVEKEEGHKESQQKDIKIIDDRGKEEKDNIIEELNSPVEILQNEGLSKAETEKDKEQEEPSGPQAGAAKRDDKPQAEETQDYGSPGIEEPAGQNNAEAYESSVNPVRPEAYEDTDTVYDPETEGLGQQNVTEDLVYQENLDLQAGVNSEEYRRSGEKQPFFEDHPLAKRIYRSFPRMYPFEDNEIAWCVRIEPQDIGLFPMEAWILGNNSFLLHGYYSYRHLIFARMNDKNGFSYILGVPGIYHNREKFMARMFGFENFKCVKRKAQRTGEFGYWYIPITLN